MANNKSKKSDRSSNQETEDYNTPMDPMQRHTGMYEKGDGKEEAKPESGTSNTGIEGAPNQGTEKR